MPITFAWYDDEKTFVRIDLDGIWQWNDYHTAQAAINAMIDEVDHRVHYLIDARKSAALPPGSLLHLPRTLTNRHPRRGGTIVVGASPVILHLFAAITRVFHPLSNLGNHFVETLDEAEILIEQLRKAGQP